MHSVIGQLCISALVPSDFENLLFSDELVTVSESGRELGEFVVTVTPVKRNQVDCFLVHANSQGTIDGVPCGTTITAFVSKSLDTLEQQHHEFVKVCIFLILHVTRESATAFFFLNMQQVKMIIL